MTNPWPPWHNWQKRPSLDLATQHNPSLSLILFFKILSGFCLRALWITVNFVVLGLLILFLGLLRSNPLCLPHPPGLNIEPLPPLLRNSTSCTPYSRSFIFPFVTFFPFSVIMFLPLLSNKLRLTFILSRKRFFARTFVSSLFQAKTIWQMCLLSFLQLLIFRLCVAN